MEITIYHTNDIHSDFSFLGKVHRYMQKHKCADDFYFDSGDFCDRKNPLVVADGGKSAFVLFSSCQIDAMALGNNEMDMGKESVESFSASFPLLGSNCRHEDYTALRSVRDAVILEKKGKRFLIIGSVPYYGFTHQPEEFNRFFLMGGLRSTNPFEAIHQQLALYKGKYDYSILLSHNGHIIDEMILEEFPEIDYVLGGHTHVVMQKERYSQSGQGEKLAKIVLKMGEKLELISHEQLDLREEVDCEFQSLLTAKEHQAEALLSAELPLYRELSFDAYRENEFINFLCDTLYLRFKGDFALMHNGIAESGLFRPVSRKTLLRCLPSKLNVTTMKLTGKQLKEAVRLSREEKVIHQDGKGPGFRGSTLGTLSFSYNVELYENAFLWNGIEIDDQQEYTVITDDYLQRGTGYPSLRVNMEEVILHRELIREVVREGINNPDNFRHITKKRRKLFLRK